MDTLDIAHDSKLYKCKVLQQFKIKDCIDVVFYNY